MKVHAIEESTLSLLLEMGKSSWPKEYLMLLGAEKGVINTVYPLPGSEGGYYISSIRMDMLPLGMSYVGTAHSHPYYGRMDDPIILEDLGIGFVEENPSCDRDTNCAEDLLDDADLIDDDELIGDDDDDDLIGDDNLLEDDATYNDKSKYLPYTPTDVPPFNILQPSRVDYATFSSIGQVHIIVGSPFDEHSWRAFGRDGKEITLEVVSE